MPFAAHDLPSCYWMKFLCWTRWSHDQVISWSVLKWLICSFIKSNWWSAVQKNGVGTQLHDSEFHAGFFCPLILLQLSRPFIFLWCYSTAHLCIDNISQLCAINVFYCYTPTSCAKVRNRNLNNNSPWNFNSNICMKSRKTRSVRVPLWKIHWFSLEKIKFIPLSVKHLVNDMLA